MIPQDCLIFTDSGPSDHGCIPTRVAQQYPYSSELTDHPLMINP